MRFISLSILVLLSFFNIQSAEAGLYPCRDTSVQEYLNLSNILVSFETELGQKVEIEIHGNINDQVGCESVRFAGSLVDYSRDFSMPQGKEFVSRVQVNGKEVVTLGRLYHSYVINQNSEDGNPKDGVQTVIFNTRSQGESPLNQLIFLVRSSGTFFRTSVGREIPVTVKR